MFAAVGFWTIVLGYALVYTGGSWFVDSTTAPTLGHALGLSGSILAADRQQGTVTKNAGEDAMRGVPRSVPPSPVTSGNYYS